MDEPYIAAYSDTTSQAFISKAAQIEASLLPTLQQQAPNAGITGVRVVALNEGSIVPEILVTSSRTTLEGEVIQKAVVGTCSGGGLKLKVINCDGITTQSKKHL